MAGDRCSICDFICRFSDTLKHTSLCLHITIEQRDSKLPHNTTKLKLATGPTFWETDHSSCVLSLQLYFFVSHCVVFTVENACWVTALAYSAMGTAALTEHTDHIWALRWTSYTCPLSGLYLSSGDRLTLLSLPCPSSSPPAPCSWTDWRLWMFYMLSLRLEGMKERWKLGNG